MTLLRHSLRLRALTHGAVCRNPEFNTLSVPRRALSRGQQLAGRASASRFGCCRLCETSDRCGVPEDNSDGMDTAYYVAGSLFVILITAAVLSRGWSTVEVQAIGVKHQLLYLSPFVCVRECVRMFNTFLHKEVLYVSNEIFFLLRYCRVGTCRPYADSRAGGDHRANRCHRTMGRFSQQLTTTKRNSIE